MAENAVQRHEKWVLENEKQKETITEGYRRIIGSEDR